MPCVGRFDMKLSMPSVATAELPALAEKAAARIAARPAPPPLPTRRVEGRWRLLVAFEAAAPRDDVPRPPLHVGVVAAAERQLGPVGERDQEDRLVGQGARHARVAPRQPAVRMLAGIADLPTHESFSLWAGPSRRRRCRPSRDATEAGGVAASASGHLFAGTSIDKEWVLLGDWSLQRSRMAPGDWSLRDDPGV